MTNANPAILTRTYSIGRADFLEYQVIYDGRVVIVEMTRAILAGWNIGKVICQGAADWPDMTRDQIVAWKLANARGDGYDPMPATDVRPEFLAKLLAL